MPLMRSTVLPRVTRVSRRATQCRVLLSQQYSARLASSSAATATEPSQGAFELPKLKPRASLSQGSQNPSDPKRLATQTAFVRTWDPLTSIVDVWALTRAVERKYGPILESHFIKDFEMPSKYQLMAWFIFQNVESLQRIPENGEEFSILAPKAQTIHPHEISMEDLEPYSETGVYNPEFEFENPQPSEDQRVIGATIKWADSEFMTTGANANLYQRSPRRTMEKFLEWGGFSELTPSSRRVHLSDLFNDKSDLDHATMRAALQICTQNVGAPIPRKSTGHVNPLNPLTSIAEDAPQTSRVFAGLYDTKSPTLGRMKTREASEQPVDSVANEALRPAVDASLESSPTLQTVPPATSSSSTSTTKEQAQPHKAPPPALTGEERKTLDRQMNAARLLQQAVASERRKHPKPRPAPPPPAPLPASRSRPLLEYPLEEPATEPKGVLGKLWSLFGR